MSFKTELSSYIAASYSALYITTHEESRVCDEIFEMFEGKQKVFEWDSLAGLYEKLPGKKTKNIKETVDPIAAFAAITNLCQTGNEDCIYILKDFHLQLEHPLKKVNVIRAFKTASNFLTAVGSIVLFVAPVVKLPVELVKDIQLIDYSLPTETAIESQLDFIIESVNGEKKERDKLKIEASIRETAIQAAKGMTDAEIENAFSLAIVKNKAFDAGFVKSVFAEKIQQVRKGGLLTYMETDETFDTVGGLDGVKAWMRTRKDGFSKRARDYKLPYPKGIGLAGIAGCGKTLISKAIANELGFPLFQLNIANLFSKFVGDTEQNFIEMIKTVESIGRCVLQIDEIEKYLNTSAVSGQGDSGTGSRSFGTLLSWLNDRKSPAFIIATSNNHLILPVELVRKGRFDEWFWIDLPSPEEREAIFDVVVKRYGRDPENFDLDELAKAADKFTGAEIDNVFKDAMFRAFAINKEVAQEHVLLEISLVTPQAVINEVKIAEMREKVEGRLRVATTFADTAAIPTKRKVRA